MTERLKQVSEILGIPTLYVGSAEGRECDEIAVEKFVNTCNLTATEITDGMSDTLDNQIYASVIIYEDKESFILDVSKEMNLKGRIGIGYKKREKFLLQYKLDKPTNYCAKSGSDNGYQLHIKVLIN